MQPGPAQCQPNAGPVPGVAQRLDRAMMGRPWAEFGPGLGRLTLWLTRPVAAWTGPVPAWYGPDIAQLQPYKLEAAQVLPLLGQKPAHKANYACSPRAVAQRPQCTVMRAC